VGPLLYPMDTPEAVENVGKRLEFIEREVAVAEKKIEEKNASAQALAKEIQVNDTWPLHAYVHICTHVHTHMHSCKHVQDAHGCRSPTLTLSSP